MLTPTTAQVAALAALFGITPKTHPHMYRLRQEEYPDGTGYWEEWWSDIPDPLGPDADSVWLAPAMRWLDKRFDGISFVWVQEELVCILSIKGKTPIAGQPSYHYSRTESLLRACQDAGVHEVVAAIGDEA